VKIRYTSGSAKEVPDLISANCSSSQSSASGETQPRKKIADVTAMIDRETGELWKPGRPVIDRLVTTRALSSVRAHSGHFWPTDASWEHSTQIGLPHVVHDKRVARSGCR
jgi:hypothetical protein